ncbi:MAG: T9SS type A sorting domain-containing protein [Bacteroidia bacterium]
MESIKAKLYHFPLLIIVAAFFNINNANAQYFDFEVFDGSIESNTMPSSIYGNENVTIKSLDYSGDTLWAGTYLDGFIKWWRRGEKASAWFSFNSFEGNEIYNIKAQASTRIFFTDYNSFTDTYYGLHVLRNQERPVAPILREIEYMGVDSSENNRLPRVNDIDIIGDSLVLLATDSGLVMFDGVKRFRRRNPANIATIEDWKIDKIGANSNGNMFLVSENRIYTENNGKWNKIDLAEKPYRLRNAQVKSVKKGPGDTMWIVMNTAIVKLHSDTLIVWPNEEIKDRQNEVKDVAFDSLGNPWLIFELNGGIMFLDESTGNKKWLKINSTISNLPDEVSCITVNESGKVYLGTDNNGLFKYLSYTPGSISYAWPNDVNLFPSYSRNGKFNFENNESENFLIEIHDLQGRLIKQLPLNAHASIAISLQKGTYLATLKNENISVSKKIISIAN